MKQKIFLVCWLLVLAFAAVGQVQNKKEAAKNPNYVYNCDSLSVYCEFWDTGKNTVFIRIKGASYLDFEYQNRERKKFIDNEIILIAGKEKWQEQNPNKKIVAMTTILFDGTFNILKGLLISYEIQK